MANGEDSITAWFAEKSTAGKGAFPIGIGDDMAQAMVGADASVLITTDMLLEGVHFDLDKISVHQAGYKAMAVSLSDCAAMATKPICGVVSVALPFGSSENVLKDLHAGIVEACEPFGCVLIGGDITAWRTSQQGKPMVINSTILSVPCKADPVKRSGAKVGDCVCVTGGLGGSLAGRHATFVPRVDEAIRIAEAVTVNSMMDISDGVSTDLNRICRASGVGALLDAERIPVSADVEESDFDKRIAVALNDGEDFELLFTLARSEYDKLISGWDMPLKITEIGSITESDIIELKMPDGTTKEVTPSGFDHL